VAGQHGRKRAWAEWKACVEAPGRLEVVVAVVASAVVVAWSGAPLVEDALFWWVPKALLVAEQGPRLVLDGGLPDGMIIGRELATLPPQWLVGLPDYAHPPLWYWWLGAWLRLFGNSVVVIHLACVPFAAALGWGSVALARRLGSPWAGLAPLAVPPVVAQLVRPELDLPLLACTVWALVALLGGRWALFAVMGVLAVFFKEPGVLLCVPAAVMWTLADRKWTHLPAVLAPLIALGVWGLVHGGLAGAERLPDSAAAWLTIDLPLAVRLLVVEQFRWLWLVGAVAGAWVLRPRDRIAWGVAGALVVCWLLFFSVVGFRLQPHNPEPLTHVRYFGPAFVVGAILAASRWPILVLPGLLFIHQRSVFGPEASFHGVDAGRAEAAAAPWIADAIDEGHTVWVGSYQAAALSQPWSGHPGTPVGGVKVYSVDTRPESLLVGDLVVLAAYGEPAGPIVRAWKLDPVRDWTAGEATVTAAEVKAPQRR